MIKWEDIGGLQVVSKLDEVIKKWFEVELLYSDSHYKLKSDQCTPDYAFNSLFLKLMLQSVGGNALVHDDIEKFTESFNESPDQIKLFKTSIDNVYCMATQVKIEGEFQGIVFAYPFVLESCSSAEQKEIVNTLIGLNIDSNDAQMAVERVRKLSSKDKEFLKGIIEIVAEEISTYHVEISKREARIHELNSELGDKYRYHSMIGKSKKMQQIYNLLERISASESSVLVQGENGTGKELVAKAIHYYSSRRDNVFLAVNCSAFNDNLLDSELFGHVKGAFTGAIKDKKGLFEQADGGTLFLDEIGDTSLTMQVKLLRVLQEGTFLPVGATIPKKADVRLICATNRNLKEMMENDEFREDLYYRINVINVNLPPLRERREDISILIEHFLQKRCAESGLPLKQLSKRTLEKMLDYPWPGNVRELENEIERLVVLAGQEKVLHHDLLSPRIYEYGEKPATGKGIDTSGNLKDALEELEAIMIKEGLKRCNYNRSRLSRELGVSRASLISKIEKYELDKRRKLGNE